MKVKKIITVALVLFMLMPFFPIVSVEAEADDSVSAILTRSNIIVNDEQKNFEAYTINGSNYFKLRDLAFALNGTEKQFEVGWNQAENSISLTSGQPYTANGTEMTGSGSGNKTALPTNSNLFLDDVQITLEAYNIDGSNYFKLRDIAALIDFVVDWDGARNLITISSKGSYYSRKWQLDDSSVLYEYERLVPAINHRSVSVIGMYSLFNYSVKTNNGQIQDLPYEFMDKLSNGYFRAVYDIEYKIDWSTEIAEEMYYTGKMIYLDEKLNLINNEIYVSAYDFIGNFSIASKSVIVYLDVDDIDNFDGWSAGMYHDKELNKIYYYSSILYMVYADGSEREINDYYVVARADDYLILKSGSFSFVLDTEGNEIFRTEQRIDFAYLGNGYFLVAPTGVMDNNGNIIITQGEYEYIGTYSNGAFPVARKFSGWTGAGESNAGFAFSRYPHSINYRAIPSVGKPPVGCSDYVWIGVDGSVLRALTTDEITRLEAGETLIYR